MLFHFKAIRIHFLLVILSILPAAGCDCGGEDETVNYYITTVDDDSVEASSTSTTTTTQGTAGSSTTTTSTEPATTTVSSSTSTTTITVPSTSTTTVTSTSTTSTSTSTSTTTTSTTTTTQPPIELHATNKFNDAIDMTILVGDDGRLAAIAGGWSFLTGLPSDDWYELVSVDVTEDIPLVFAPDLSTPSRTAYTLHKEAFQGTAWVQRDTGIVTLDLNVVGVYENESDLNDRIYGRTVNEACLGGYPPMLFGVALFERECWSDLEGSLYTFDPEFDMWWVDSHECVNVYLFHSNPDCDWDGSVLYRYNEQSDIWAPLQQYDPDPTNCSWFSSSGHGLFIDFMSNYLFHDLYTLNLFRVVDGCGIVSNELSLRIFFYPTSYDASAQSAGRNAKLAEEVYYNDHGGEISGGYASNLNDLLIYDRNLTDDTEVTFSFGICTTSGYTFQTRHLRGSRIYTWTD